MDCFIVQKDRHRRAELFGSAGPENAHILKFVEGAVKRRMLDQTMTEVCSKFADPLPEALEAATDEAVKDARKASASRLG